jgi:DNA-binding MarR family transcriptional regulator
VFVLKNYFGHRLRLLHWGTEQFMSEALAKMDLTASQGHIMGFLCRQSSPPCARDIEEFFQLSHPTVSGILTRLEKKGFIEFRPDDHDRRCKRIHVLPKGAECHQRIMDAIRENEIRMMEGFTDEERQQFSAFLDRAIQNSGCECKHKPKEEPNQ